MMRFPVESAAYVAEVLNDRAPAHPDTYDFWYLEPFSGPYCFRQFLVCPFQEFVVFTAQCSFPTEACVAQYLLIPFLKENVNLSRLQVEAGQILEGQKTKVRIEGPWRTRPS